MDDRAGSSVGRRVTLETAVTQLEVPGERNRDR